MPVKRVLLLGTTGVDKETATSALLKHLIDENMHLPEENKVKAPRIVDFEHEYIVGKLRIPMRRFLDKQEDDQRLNWNEAWDLFVADLNSDFADQDVILSLHGVVARWLYGFRSPINRHKLCEHFRPTTIIHLIDDVYYS